MHLEHTDHDEAKPVDLGETRRRFLLAREQASQCEAEHYRAVRTLRSWGAYRSRPMTADGDMAGPWTERI
jgi:hypothetical protein